MAITANDDHLATIVKTIDDRLATRERKRIEWETKITTVRNAITILNNAHKQHVEGEKKFLENIKNMILRKMTTGGENILVSPQTPGMANPRQFATVESDQEDDDDLMGYESGIRFDTLLRTPERSPGTAMPSDPIPSVETQNRAVFPPQRDSIDLTREPELRRSNVPAASGLNSGGKRKRQEPGPSSTGKLKRPRIAMNSAVIPGPSSMAPPPRPMQPPPRKAAQAGERRTKNMLENFQRGERYMSTAWKEQSVPPAAFCTCGKHDCSICNAQKQGR